MQEVILILSILILVAVVIVNYQLYELRMDLRYGLAPRLDRVDGKLEELANSEAMDKVMAQAPVSNSRTMWD